MGNCGSNDDDDKNKNGKSSNNNNNTTSTTTNPLSGKNAQQQQKVKRSDSLSSIEIDPEDENELALDNHRTIDDLQANWDRKMNHAPANNNNKTTTANNSSSNSPPNNQNSNENNHNTSDLYSSNSSVLSNRSSGQGANLVGGDLGKQREEAAIDLVDEFFVWDDMKYDLRKDRATRENLNNLMRPSTQGNNTTKAGATMSSEDGNNNNGTSTGAVEGRARSGSRKFRRGNNSNTPMKVSDEPADAPASSTASSSNDNKSRVKKASPFIFNDFAVDELDFDEDDEAEMERDGLSFFTAASVTLAAAAASGNALHSSPEHHNSNNNNHHHHHGSTGNPFEGKGDNSSSVSTNNSRNASSSDSDIKSPTSPLNRVTASNNRRGSSSQKDNNNSVNSPVALKLRNLGGNADEVRNVTFTTLAGHTTRVKVLAIAPGEKEYVSCSSDDFNLTYADLSSGKELGAFIGHTENVLHATFSCCGKYLSSTSRDNTMILWDVVTQKAMLTFEHAKVVICSVFSKDSRFIATGCQDKVCRLWEARRGRELGSFNQHEGIIIAMAFAPDNTFVVSASSDRTLRKWSGVPSKEQAMAALAAKAKGEKVPPPQVGKQLGIMSGHEGIILSCTFTSDAKYIISNDERLVKIWNAETCILYKTFKVDETVSLRNLPSNKKLTWTLAAAAPGMFPKHFMVAANNRFLYVYNIETGAEEVNLYCKSPIYCLTAGQRAAALCGDAFGNVYCMRLANPYLTLEPPAASRPATPALKGNDFS